MALPTNFNPGDAGHVEAHEATNIELNRVAGIADGLSDSLAETIRATLGATLVAGANVTITVNDAGNTVTIAATGGSGGGGGDIDGSQIVSGTVPVARLGASGTRDATTYLRGDNAWVSPPAGGGSSGGPFMIPAGAWWSGDIEVGSGGSYCTPPAGTLLCQPIMIPAGLTADTLRIHVAEAGGVGVVGRLGLYASNPSARCRPTGPALVDVTVDVWTTGGQNAAATIGPLSGGLYWLAYVAQGGTPPMLRARDDTKLTVMGSEWDDGWAVGNTAVHYIGYRYTGVNGALPDLTSLTPTVHLAETYLMPRLGMRIS